MNLETFFEKFDLFADCPNAVQKMRELILELAVQGKLVEQRGEGCDWRHDESMPFAIPGQWAWKTMGDVTEIVRGITFPGSAKAKIPGEGMVACLRTASIQDEIDWDDLIYVPHSFVGREDQWVKSDDVMISMANSYELVGKVAVVRDVPVKASFGGFIAAIRPKGIDPFFLLYYLRSPRMQSAFRASSSQTTNIANISLGRMRPLPFALPPLAEQKRIVAKVDELMALCDALEAQQKERETKRTALAKASLAAFAEAPSPQSLELLFHPSYAIDPADLRKSILTLAVQGKLVEQREDCESFELFKSFDGAAVNDADAICPESWLQVPLGKMGEWRGGGTPSKHKPEYWDGDVPWVSPKDMKVLEICDAADHISLAAIRESSVRLIPRNSLLMVVRGMILAHSFPVAVTAVDVTINQDMKALIPFEEQVTPYLLLALMALKSKVVSLIERSTHGTCKLETHVLHALVIPLPPLAEQKRIVAKVDELMALVDRLEALGTAARDTASRLLEAMVAELSGRAAA